MTAIPWGITEGSSQWLDLVQAVSRLEEGVGGGGGGGGGRDGSDG